MDQQLGIAGSKAFILSVGWLLIAAGVGLAVLRFTLGDAHYETIPERALSSLPFGAVVAAALALFVHEDPRSYQTSSSGGTVSDIVTPLEALISLAITCTSVGVGWFLSKPRAPRQPRKEKGRQ